MLDKEKRSDGKLKSKISNRRRIHIDDIIQHTLRPGRCVAIFFQFLPELIVTALRKAASSSGVHFPADARRLYSGDFFRALVSSVESSSSEAESWLDSWCAILATVVNDDNLTFASVLDGDFDVALLTLSEVCLGRSCGLFGVDLRRPEIASSGSLSLEPVSDTLDLISSE